MFASRIGLQRKNFSILYNTRRTFIGTFKRQQRFRPPASDPLTNSGNKIPHTIHETSPLSQNDATSLVNTLRSRSSHESIESISYVRPLVFGSVVCVSAFVVAGVVYDRQQETVWQRWMAHMRQQQQDGDDPVLSRSLGSWFRGRFRGNEIQVDDEGRVVVTPTLRELWLEKRALLLERRQEWMDKMNERLQRWQKLYGMPEGLKRLGLIVAGKLASMTEAERTLAMLVGLNVLVFGAWQVPRWTPFMARWFMHHPGASNRPITLITSCFSHKDGLHLACNMIGLWSFGGLMHEYLGQQQFLALYLTTGVGANMASHVLSLAFRRSRPLLPSLGASGAIYGLISGTAYLEPQASVSLLFFLPIKLGYALPAMMGFDIAGILLKWKMFDHYAHLAGASIGLGYLAYGQSHVWQPLIKNIHAIRTQQSSS